MTQPNSHPSRRQVLQIAAAGAVAGILAPMMTTTTRAADGAPITLPRSTPGALGIDPAGIAAFIDAVNQRVEGLHSFLLLRHGQVAAEGSWTPYQPQRPHMLFSLSKSFTSTAVGLAVAEGRLSVEDPVLSFFPDETPADVSDHLAAMRVKHLLTMSTGHETEPNVRTDDNWVRAFLAAPVEHAPGTHFLYNTAATHVLSGIVQKLTGQRLTDYLTPRLFQPLGIATPTWQQSPLGIDVGGYGLKVTVEDIARFGQLYLQKGMWNGRQLVPEAWIAEATRGQVSNGDPVTGSDWNQGYGYQFWRCKHDNYRGDGAFGQFCIVMPHHDAVLAITSGVSDMGAVMDSAWTHLLPAMKEGPVSDDGTDALRKTLARLIVPAPAGERTSPTAEQVSGQTWRLEPNDDKLESIRLEFTSDRCTLTATGPAGSNSLDIGLDTWLPGSIPDDAGPQPVACRGAWTDDGRFAFRICLVEGPFIRSQTLRFEASGDLSIEDRRVNVGFGELTRPPIKGTRQTA